MLRRIFAESIYLPKTIFGYKFESHTEYKSIDNHGNTLKKMLYCIYIPYHHGEKHFFRGSSLYPETSP